MSAVLEPAFSSCLGIGPAEASQNVLSGRMERHQSVPIGDGSRTGLAVVQCSVPTCWQRTRVFERVLNSEEAHSKGKKERRKCLLHGDNKG